ncbi:MAG: hypothetical protein IJU52_08860, partial [Clostridia bacterium]|nr:hypothetical protein [Clostridia bacterium]
RLGFVILLDNKRSPVRTKPQKSRKTDGIPTIRFAGAAHLQANETAPSRGFCLLPEGTRAFRAAA